MRQRLNSVLAIALAVVGLSGCGSLLPTPKQKAIYTLNLPPTSVVDDIGNWQLLVEQPNAKAVLQTTRIAVIEPSGRYNYLTEARWDDQVLRLWQRLIVESLEGVGVARAVRDQASVAGDFRLLTDLRQFYARYPDSGPADITVELAIKLVRQRDGRIFAARSFRSVDTADDRSNAATIGAFQKASGAVLAQAVTWLVETANTEFATGDYAGNGTADSADR